MFLKSILLGFPVCSVISTILTPPPQRVYLESIIKDNMHCKVYENIKKTYVLKLDLEQEAKLDQELEQEQEAKLKIKPASCQIVDFSHHKKKHGEILNWREVDSVIRDEMRDEMTKSEAFNSILINIEKYTQSVEFKYLVFKDMITLRYLARMLGGGNHSEICEQLNIKVNNNLDACNDQITKITKNVMHRVNIKFT